MLTDAFGSTFGPMTRGAVQRGKFSLERVYALLALPGMDVLQGRKQRCLPLEIQT